MVCLYFLQNEESMSCNSKPTPTVEKIQLKSDLKISKGEGDKFLRRFEKFVSKQTVAFFSHKMDTSK